MIALRLVIAVLAHNEERRIARCLSSLPVGRPGVDVHVVVNGSRDRTAAIARGFGVRVHDWAQGGKSRSWNRFVHDTPGVEGDAFVFVDGDAEVVPGSIAALAGALSAAEGINAASAMPRNGRQAAAYQREMLARRGLFGDLYALSGRFVRRMRARRIRLPVDLVGDDSLIGALAKTDLRGEADWRDQRLLPVPEAGFLCEPTDPASPSSLKRQYGRMVNYSVRYFQNRIVSEIMRGPGPEALPGQMADLYCEWLPRFRPRRDPLHWWFDRQALARMRQGLPPKR